MAEPIQARATQTQVVVNTFIRSVYNWMAVGLTLTGVIAFYVAGVVENMMQTNPAALRSIQPIFFVLIIAELGLVFYLSARIQKIEATTATALFIIYAMLNGVTLSFIFIAYTAASIASTFFVCAATFGACSVYGMVTKKDLTSVGQFMFMGLIGIIIASVVNIFLRSPAMNMIISYIGVFVFVGLTAYDTQKLKHMALTQPEGLDPAVARKGAIMGALTLYLDFINMFLFLLRILGTSRD
ncbi:MAG: Bax inhibitor-1/YccA family protein [Thermodesulfobacteriota bacterium]|nr:Bax inhibitor-1/YccA family protein [Thermodesulfobacteriota bacterium]